MTPAKFGDLVFRASHRRPWGPLVIERAGLPGCGLEWGGEAFLAGAQELGVGGGF